MKFQPLSMQDLNDKHYGNVNIKLDVICRCTGKLKMVKVMDVHVLLLIISIMHS